MLDLETTSHASSQAAYLNLLSNVGTTSLSLSKPSKICKGGNCISRSSVLSASGRIASRNRSTQMQQRRFPINSGDHTAALSNLSIPLAGSMTGERPVDIVYLLDTILRLLQFENSRITPVTGL